VWCVIYISSALTAEHTAEVVGDETSASVAVSDFTTLKSGNTIQPLQRIDISHSLHAFTPLDTKGNVFWGGSRACIYGALTSLSS
jgi:hypothetical protein